MNRGNANLNEDMIIAVVISIYEIANKPEKKIWDSSRIQTHGVYVSMAVLYQLSYKDPYIASLLESTFFTYPHPFCKSAAFIYQYAWSALPVF